MTNLISHDCETELIGKDAITPDWICSGIAFLQDDGDIETALISERSEGWQGVHKGLYDENADHYLIYHNGAFDLRVISRDDQEMMDLVWKKLMKGEIKDTLIREKLLNLTEWGNIDTPNGRQALYSQAALEKKYLGIDRSEQKKEGSARTNYALVRHMPVHEWDEEFSSYAQDDPKYCLMIYLEQEIRRRDVIDRIGIDPFAQENFRVQYSFALALMTVEGLPIDKEKLAETKEYFETAYNDPKLVRPLVGAGIVTPAVPPMPYARGQKNHLLSCINHKDSPEKSSKKVPCDCPAKMKAAVPEKYSRKTLHQYIWKLGVSNPEIEIWVGDSTADKLREDGGWTSTTPGSVNTEMFLHDTKYKGLTDDPNFVPKEVILANGRIVKAEFLKENPEIPKGWLIKVDKEWLEAFSHMDEITELYAKRKALEKMITSYLPRMFYEDDDGEKIPADTIHADFDCLKRTGRTSSRSSKLYPSWNGQQVDPRIRPCAVALPGHALVSIDYNAMELGTLAQTCINLFGHSILADVINKGEDPHGFLGAQIAYALDPMFQEMADIMRIENSCKTHEDNVWSDYNLFKEFKGTDSAWTSAAFEPIYRKLYEKKDMAMSCATFYKHYRTFAKPTGLGYPGGLGPNTFVQYARATYKVEVNLETATLLRDIWKATFPELAQYLNHISSNSFDPNHQPVMEEDRRDGKRKKRNFYSYDTPLGLHRAKTDFCACANGTGLQSPSAEGAGLAVIEVQRLCYTTNDSIISRVGRPQPPVRCALFIHDEILGQFVLDGKESERVEFIEEVMVRNMERITPDVKAGTEPAMMLRWDKFADTVRDDNGKLIPWVKEEKEIGE